ncbi:ectopic P granules protein 5 homolog [Protopterus annectens]|uniref:ectopic P granules protein 5 homolog n=1 Tax=Protopterus annectens TaxID=7888 RepID=UPI001CFA5892|nr:ectopic P granules protein 5 homolog [Protopterus annectens]
MMAEAVRPRKTKVKSGGKIQEKKKCKEDLKTKHDKSFLDANLLPVVPREHGEPMSDSSKKELQPKEVLPSFGQQIQELQEIIETPLNYQDATDHVHKLSDLQSISQLLETDHDSCENTEQLNVLTYEQNAVGDNQFTEIPLSDEFDSKCIETSNVPSDTLPVCVASSFADAEQALEPHRLKKILLSDQVASKDVIEACAVPFTSSSLVEDVCNGADTQQPKIVCSDAKQLHESHCHSSDSPHFEECAAESQNLDNENENLAKTEALYSSVETANYKHLHDASILMQPTAPSFHQMANVVEDKELEMKSSIRRPAVLSVGELPLTHFSIHSERGDIHEQPVLAKPYSMLQGMASGEKESTGVTTAVACSERLYPEIPPDPESVPFTKEELKMFEPGSWLENVESYTEEFENIAYQDGHEFKELLMNYWRCRRQLLLAEVKLQTLASDCKSTKKRLWTFTDGQITLNGVCADQAKVTGYHRFQTVEMSKSALEDLQHIFEMKTDQLHQTLALHSYTSVLSRLQVESFIYRLLSSSPLKKASAVKHLEQASHDVECHQSYVQHLKECISVLFGFTRRVLEDDQFQNDIHHWLQQLVSTLHRIGSSGDHIFLLNHILRCPAGVGKWAVPFVQIKIQDNPWGVFHFMQALALLMSPVRNRADFLCHMKPCETNASLTSGKESGNWTLVDEGGEEDEDPETSWMLLAEDDLIALFSQFPFDELFKHLLGINTRGSYLPQQTTCQLMMKIFAFATSVMELLAVGLQTFNRARYRQFVKQVGLMMRLTICYVSAHWAQYIGFNSNQEKHLRHQPFSLVKLQIEFDEFFLRAVLHVLNAKRLGIWLFMSEMPYGTLSSSMLWKLFYIMHCAEGENLERLCSSLNPSDCKQRCKDPEHTEKFETYLASMNSSDGICLLTTFAHMTLCRQTDVDEDLVKMIVLEIYEVSYLSLSTREVYSKVGRELLATIATSYPQTISGLLERVAETIEKVGMVSLYLFKELPLQLWRPTALEIGVIREWLLNYNLAAVENKLACIILEGLNWGFDEHTGGLNLDHSLHLEVGLMVLEAYQKYLTDKPYGGFISESIKQVSYLASIVRLSQTPEASFNQWAWDLVVRLKLHINDQNPQCRLPQVSNITAALDMTESPTVHPLQKAVKAGIPIGCYLALSATTVGHSIDKFCSEGIPLFENLVRSRYLRATVHVLDKILPYFYSFPFYLLKNEKFLSCIQHFIQLDSGVPQGMTQQVTQKVTQHLTGANYGDNIRLLNSMIQDHISDSCKPGKVGPVAVLEFWVQACTSQPLWHRDRTILYLMDHLCKAAFTYSQEDCVQKLLYQQHKNALGYHSDRGFLSSLVNWIVAGNVTPSFIEGSSNSSEVWFSWIVLNMEAIFEEDSQLNRVVERELALKPSSTPDEALKKAQSYLKLPIVPSLQRFLIYRWACQALSTPADHPLLPLIWQKFFLLYLHRPGPEYGLPLSGCIGKRFFHSPAHMNLLNDMKKRLVELADFHHSASKALKVQMNEDGNGINDDSSSSPANYLTSPVVHRELVRLFNVFTAWLEDENFQKSPVPLHSLPKQYDTHRLAKIMQNQQDLWTEYVDLERIRHEILEVKNLWIEVKYEPSSSISSAPAFVDFTNASTAKETVLASLKKHEAPCPPAVVPSMKAPVPTANASCLSNEKAAVHFIQRHLNLLQQHAKVAAVWESQQVALDLDLLDSLPKLYCNREEQITMHLECRGTSSHKCQGAAVVTAKHDCLYMNEAVKQHITGLQKEIKQVQADAMKPPPQNIAEAAVCVENFITALVNAYKLQPGACTQKVGIAVFYTIVKLVCDETQRHPPTRQFFTSCIEIVGQVFISDTKSECSPLLKTILMNRRLCSLVAPYFTPNASPDEFVHLYKKVVNALHEDNSDVIFMLLTKFDLPLWLNTRPSLSERSKLLELVHVALTSCGMHPEEELLMPFSIFCKHWTMILKYHFPDHYSDFLRLLTSSSAEQCLSPDCWKMSLKALGCCPTACKKIPGTGASDRKCIQSSAQVQLSPQQVKETIEWLANFFCKLRLSKADFKSFGLFSKWSPYVAYVEQFFLFLVESLIDSEKNSLVEEPKAQGEIITGLKSLHYRITELFKPWILVLDAEDDSNRRCYPWLESDASVATAMVQLFTKCIDQLHQSYKDLLIPGQRGALWLHLLHYCETCTSPKMPEYILYTYHMEYATLPWREMHPDHTLMEAFFKVERGSPKSCFLFLGTVLCEVNWVSVLSDAWNAQPNQNTRAMVVCLLFMMVFLAKEDVLLSKSESPLLNLLGQTRSLPWHLVDIVAYQNVISYFSSHYSPSVILAKQPSDELTLKLLMVSAGFGASSESNLHVDVTLKCQTYIRQVILFLTTLEQNGQVTLPVVEQEMVQLLDNIIIFNPPDVDIQKRHMSLSSLFVEVLMLLNNATVTTAESLRLSLRNWIESKVHCPLVLPMLTAACQSLASVRHMAQTTEACITAFFKEGGSSDQYSGWGPILVSLQVPELTTEEFLQECILLGSYLTLYVYILQRLNIEQTSANEWKILSVLISWIQQVFPSSTNDEAKLFLWWHKTLELALLQTEDTTVLDAVIQVFVKLQTRQIQLAEERLSSGILGAIGLGKKSPLSNRFRIVARSMSAFLLVQVPADNRIRLKPGTELQLSHKAQQALNSLESLSSNKHYAEYEEQLSQALLFIKYPGHCLHDGNKLLALLINSLYPEVQYLDIIRR